MSWMRAFARSSGAVAAVGGVAAGGWWTHTSFAEEGHWHQPEKYRQGYPYPQWDSKWDVRNEVDGTVDKAKASAKGAARGVTRHIILVRHGQYDMSSPHDCDRILTALGREQATLTGKRLAAMLAAPDGGDGYPFKITHLHSSSMARAAETADLIAAEFPLDGPTVVHRPPPDDLLREGRPCHTVPGRKPGADAGRDRSVAKDGPPIEAAFRRYIHRARDDDDDHDRMANGSDAGESSSLLSPPGTTVTTTPNKVDALSSSPSSSAPSSASPSKHEYEIVVCHGNVIRYFVMRALQLPPEAWLRLTTFNCSLTYLQVRPNGCVYLRQMGDTGHLPIDKTTFSDHQGFSW